MCTGRVVEIWHQNEPITAYKVQKGYSWSPNLKAMVGTGWHLATPRIIQESGSGAYLRSDNGRFSKSVLRWQRQPKVRALSEVHLSFWHAYEHVQGCFSMVGQEETVYKVELRGLMQRSSTGELVGSEMRIVECVQLSPPRTMTYD